VGFSSRREADGFKGSVELLAKPDIVLIDRGLDFGCSYKGTHDTSKERFDHLDDHSADDHSTDDHSADDQRPFSLQSIHSLAQESHFCALLHLRVKLFCNL
jgi:hypothetical protein